LGGRVRLERHSSFADLDSEWDALAEASRNVFATREWLEAWWRHFGDGHELALTTARDQDGRLVAALPLYLWGARGLRVLRFLGHGPGDLLGPVAAPADLHAAQGALRSALGDAALRWHVFLGEQLLGAESWSTALGADVVRTTGFPIVRFAPGETWDDVLARQSGGWRANVRRRARRLADGHDVRYRLVDGGEGLQAEIDVLYDLHRRRWTNVDSPFTGPREAFHREFAELAARRGWLRLWFLDVDDIPVATTYGWRFGGVEHYYQAGRDEAWSRYAVGRLLVLHALRSALEDGLSEFRFLRGDESYKYDYATEDPKLDIVARGRGPLGATLLRAGLAVYRSRLRELLRRAVGA